VDQLPPPAGEIGQMVIFSDGDMLLQTGNLTRYDPVNRDTIWDTGWNMIGGVPLLSDDGSFYLGYGNRITHFSPEGNIIWEQELNGNYVFNSSSVFGSNGMIYAIHDGIFRIDPSGDPIWVSWFPDFAHGSPAIGYDYLIYTTIPWGLASYDENLNQLWYAVPPNGIDLNQSVVIGPDGTIYIYSGMNDLYAYSSSGELLWTFTSPVPGSWLSVALSPDGMIYAFIDFSDNDISVLYKIHPEGYSLWQVTFYPNPISHESAAIYLTPLLVDRGGNVNLCLTNSHCYGISPDGEILWDLEYPVSDSIYINVDQSPLLTGDGLMFIHRNDSKLYAYADPEIYPVLRSSVDSLDYSIEPGSLPFTTTIEITSTVRPISFTWSVADSSWLTGNVDSTQTPAQMNLTFDLTSLPTGVYTSTVLLHTDGLVGKDIRIPVHIDNGITYTYLPVSLNSYMDHSIYYYSHYFEQIQFVSIDHNGRNRKVLLENLGDIGYEVSSMSELNHILAYQRFDGQHSYIEVVDVISGEVLLELHDGSDYYRPSLSPDGSQMLFISTMDDPTGDIYLVNTDGSDLKRITFDASGQLPLLWSPTGDRFAFVGIGADIYTCNSLGENCRFLFDRDIGSPLSWSHDGTKMVVLHAYGVTSECRMYDLQTGENIVLTERCYSYEDFGPIWSPDDSLIAFISYNPSVVNIIKPDGTEWRQVYTLYVDDQKAFFIQWSPDGRWIYFSQPNSDGNNPYDIYAIHPDGSGLRKLTTNVANDQRPFCR
jgi:hypothetical protein